MADDDHDEERQLRSVALQNARAILLERQRVERALAEERERLRITLASIGDGVISVDAAGRIVYLNGVAEVLTGWSQAEAVGRPLAEVFVIVHETTRRPTDNPALRALAEGRAVELANHTVLVARDGTVRPISDSAAPMRDLAGATIGAVLVFRDASEQRHADAARAELAAIVQSSEDAIISKSLKGIIRSWNAGAERIFGYTSDEVVGRHITLLIPPDRQAEEATILERLCRGERVEHFETVRVRKDGRKLDISLTVSPIRDHEGQIIGASKVARDVTDRKRAEAALRASENRHRFLVDLAATTQPLTDPAEVMAVTARMLAEHLEVDRCAYAEVEDEAVFVITGDHGRGVPSIVGRWPVAAFGAECVRCMLANQPFVTDDVDTDPRAGADLAAYRATRIQAVICVPLHKGGRFVAAMAVHQTTPRHWTRDEIELVQTIVARSWESLERMRVARDLKDAADRLVLAFSAARLGDWSWDATTDAVTLSPRAAEIFGVPAAGPISWTELQGLLHEDDREVARLAVERSVATREPYDLEYRVRHADGREVWVSAMGRAQYQRSGAPLGMFGVVQDVTDKKHVEQALRVRAEELAEADRRKDDFIAVLAHELRNPLAPIRTGLEVMRTAAGEPGTLRSVGAMMERQLAHMVRLIDDLLDVARMSRDKLHLQKTRVALADVVSHALEAVGTAVEQAGHQLVVALPDEPVVLDADLTRLAQVFGNLLTNSAKYTPPGGRIWLTAEVHGDVVVVTVRDTGIGIPADALGRVFDMFSQVDRSLTRGTGGLGIGLALVKRLVETHGGTVTVESPGPGAGSTFTVRLPVAEPVAAPAPPPRARPRRPSGGKRVVIADDYEDGAIAMAGLLKLLGNEVHVATNGLEAIELAERIRPDLVLMDVGMPQLDGLDATRQIRARAWGQDVTIIALTGLGQPGDRERSQAAGCDGHLVKPVSIPELETLLADLPRRSSPA